MPQHRRSTATPTEGPSRRLVIRFPGDRRFHDVVEMAVEIYMRPICGDSALVPEIVRELISALAEADPGQTCEVVLACRRPELETKVTVGGRRTSRRWTVDE